MSHLRMISESVCALRRADSVQLRLTSANLGFFNSEVDACLLERVMETNGTEPRKIRVLDQLLRFRKASVCLVDQYHFTPGPEALQQPRRLIPLDVTRSGKCVVHAYFWHREKIPLGKSDSSRVAWQTPNELPRLLARAERAATPQNPSFWSIALYLVALDAISV